MHEKKIVREEARSVVIPKRRSFQEGVPVLYEARACHS